MILESVITCPKCNAAKLEMMPTDACQYFYECTGCGTLLRPNSGDCCVFCSYGSVPCPPIQESNGVPLCCQSGESRMAAEIRPGVHRPDWSVVTMPAAREALIGRNRARAGPAEKWIATLPTPQDLAWRTVLQLFGQFGRPPHLSEIGKEIGLGPDQIRMLVSELQAHDLLAVDHATGTIAYAYPFTGAATEHRVELHGHKLNALCAIDALGVGGMYQTDVTVASACRFCATNIEIRTAQNGKTLSCARPDGAVVWYDLAYNQTAATSCCPSIGFFCSDEHLQQWLAAQTTPREGCRLALDEALEVGRALFEPILATATGVTHEGVISGNFSVGV
ncbi:MAG TPA: alkylmercury lyase family protein [Tepidisphaeraceae bacterium]|nr:alkylmercury lyase family protein [Tepidisphaeraceae bacterium]